MTTMTGTRTRQEFAAAVALVAVVALAGVYLVAVRTPIGQQLDTRIMLQVSRILAHETWTGTLLSYVSPLWVAVTALLLTAVGAVRAGTRTAAAVLASVSGTVVAATILKGVLIRPQFLDGAANSLPSGHVAAVAGLTVAATLAVTPLLRPVVALTGTAVTTLTGVATLALQWHRPSDVVAATLLAIIVSAVVTASGPFNASRGPSRRVPGHVPHPLSERSSLIDRESVGPP